MFYTDYGIVVLAAGNSSRLGFPKQLLEINGESFLHRITSEMIKTGFPVVAVLGHQYNRMEREVASGVNVFCNIDWSKGIGNSIKAGVRSLFDKASGLKAVVVMPCDQPYITAELIGELIAGHRAGHKLVASAYNHEYGTPILIDHSMFKEINRLANNDDLNLILQMHSVYGVPFPLGGYDIDTEEQWKDLFSMERAKLGPKH